MQRITTFLLIFILTALPMLSIAVPVVSNLSNTTPSCTECAEAQKNLQNDQDPCSQMQGEQCSSDQCDCDTVHVSKLLSNDFSIPSIDYHLTDSQHFIFFRFLSQQPHPLYRPPIATL